MIRLTIPEILLTSVLFLLPLSCTAEAGNLSEKKLSEQKLSEKTLRDPFAASNAESALIPPKEEVLSTSSSLEKHEIRLVELKYANAGELASVINSGHGLLSEGSHLAGDERTNMLIVRERPSRLQSLIDLIASLDVPVRQIEIEARIAIINSGNVRELGVRWGLNASNRLGKIGGRTESNHYPAPVGESGSEAKAPNLDDYLNINLGSHSPGSSSIAFQIGGIGATALLDLELSALQSESKAEVISSPRLMTTNKKSAYIEQGTEIPYLESNDNGTATINFRKAVLSLEVTPQVTQDDQLILDLLVTQDRPGQIVKTGNGESVAIDTQRISTQVQVRNEETIVLGGILQHSSIRVKEKVPLLADLPFIGWLFQRNYENREKRELLIFVTPRLV